MERIKLPVLSVLLLLFVSLTACSTDSPGTGHSPGNDDTGATDTGATDTSATDTGATDTGATDTGSADTGSADTGPEDTGPADTGSDADADADAGPTTCSADADCPDPEQCVFDDQTGQMTCQAPTGTGQPGDSCTDGTDCASGICVEGVCASPCGDDADCPGGYVCQPQELDLADGSTTTVDVCVDQVEPCAADGDCVPPEVCTVDRSGDAVETVCLDPTAAGQPGDSCTDDTDCASNLCLNGQCTTPCAGSSDCADGYVCEPTEVDTATGTDSVNLCLPQPPDTCLSDGDCADPERCVADKTATDLKFVCGQPNTGGAETGQDCTADADCAQNLCVDGLCAGPCQTVGDCAGATDYSCEITQVDLGGGNTDSAEICTPPVPCLSARDCDVGEACWVKADGTQICRDPNLGGGTVGDVCTTNQACSANVCYDGRFRDVCTVPCQSNTDCGGVAGYECQATTITDIDGNSITGSFCVEKTPQPCASANECGSGLSCAVVEDTAGTALETVCVPTSGGLGTGVACTDDTDCGSLLCLGGFCASPCTDANQCGTNQICQSNTVSKSSLTGTFNLCETLPEDRCDNDGICADGVRLCNDLRQTSSAVEAYCGFPNAGGASLGTVCTQDSDCRSSICTAGNADECSVICAQDSQCAAGQVCTTYTYGTTAATQTPLGTCNTACTDNDDCAGLDFVDTSGASVEHLCIPKSNALDSQIDQVCLRERDDPNDPDDARLLGAPCDTGVDCRSGLCLRTYNSSSTCTTDADCTNAPYNSCMDIGGTMRCGVRECSYVCDESTDCTQDAISGNALTACANVQFGVGQSTGQVSMCARP